jgi:uncharacterized protein (DUF1015 family)
MAIVIPFKGVLYDPSVVNDIAQVVAPPYDVIDRAAQAGLHVRHPNNVIRLELGLEQPGDDSAANRYTRAAGLLREWLRRGVLRRDSQPAIYPYAIEYRSPGDAPDAPTKTLQGYLATMALEEFGSGHIYPHENTRAAAKADRLELLQACRANFSPIFSLFSDPAGEVQRLLQNSVDPDKPRLDFRDDEGFRQRLWQVSDPRVLGEVGEAMAPKPLFIADGHHRYETALTYRRTRRQQPGAPAPTGLQPYDAVLMLFAGLEDPGLTVLPTHRVLTTPLPPIAEIRTLLKEVCLIEEVPFRHDGEPAARRNFLRILREKGQTHHAFGLIQRGAGGFFILTLRPEHRAGLGTAARDTLDVSILHNEILSRLRADTATEHSVLYTKDDQEAIDLVRSGAQPAALLLNATKVAEVRAVAAAGDRMPHKSTYFFPKPLTGLVMNVFEEGTAQG